MKRPILESSRSAKSIQRRGKMKDSVVKRGSRWCFVIDDYDEDKHRRRRWFSGYKTQADAKEARARKLTEKADGADLDANKITVGELLTRWLETRKTRVSDRTYERYASIVKHHLTTRPRHSSAGEAETAAHRGISRVVVDGEAVRQEEREPVTP